MNPAFVKAILKYMVYSTASYCFIGMELAEVIMLKDRSYLFLSIKFCLQQ